MDQRQFNFGTNVISYQRITTIWESIDWDALAIAYKEVLRVQHSWALK